MFEKSGFLRPLPGSRLWPATVILVAAIIVAFAIQVLVLPPAWVDRYLCLSLDGLRQGYYWQLLSYQFLHAGLLHLLLNCWALYLFGREVEYALGTRRFLVLYFASGVVGGLFQELAALAWPGHFGSGVVGASAGVFGVVSAFALLNPRRPLVMLLFFVVPIRMQTITLLWVSIVISTIGIAFPDSRLVESVFGNVAHAAHMGGILTGLACVRWWERQVRRRSGRPGDPLGS
ncbi:MAG: rhomboid family intramembrane serine protease [Verrucomicrobiota bacterium]